MAQIRRKADVIEPGPKGRPGRFAVVLLLGGLVGTIHVAAFLTPSRFVPIPESLRLPLSTLGLLFLACGIYAWLARPSAVTRAFLLYGVGMGIHWGGTVGAAAPGLEIAFLVAYAAATLAGDGALLDLAVRFPGAGGRRAHAVTAAYLLAFATLLVAPVAPFLPRRTLETMVGTLFMVSFLVSIVAAGTFIVKWFRASASARRDLGLTAIATVFAVAGVANLLGEGGVLPGPSQLWALPYALVPLTLAWALTRQPR